MFCAFFADSALVFNIWLSVKEALPQFCLKSYFETAPFCVSKKWHSHFFEGMRLTAAH
jgi:hypothetical protein